MTESEKLRELEYRLWEAADQLRANSSSSAAQYSIPVPRLIFLRYADVRFTQLEKELASKASGRRKIGKADYQAQGVMYVPETSRFSYLRGLPEGSDLGAALNRAMDTIETENPDLQGVLPRDYARIDDSVLQELLRLVGGIPDDIEGDALGKIYEYFLGNFAMAEGRRAGEFFTPTSIVKLIVDIIEPFAGRILDPACGSGGMFVQSARFVEEHKRSPTSEISIFGLTKGQESQVKKIVRELLAKLKAEVLVLDWKRRQATRAAVQVAIETSLDEGLAEVYDADLFSQKAAAVFEHVFSSYQGDGKSIDEEAA